MLRPLRKLSVITALLLSTLAAQINTPFSTFDIYVYPEYDHPGVGVQIDVNIIPGKTPLAFEVEVPANTSMALLRSQSSSITVEVIGRDGKFYIPINATEARFFIQYYFNPFSSEGQNRDFTYTISLTEELSEYHLIVQQPMGALNFQQSLIGAEVFNDELGIQYFRAHIHDGLQPGASSEVDIKYDNPTGELTSTLIAPIKAQQQAARDVAPTSGMDMSTMLVLLFMALAGFAVIAKFTGKKSARAVPAPAIGGKKKKKGKFCSSCGSPKSTADKFCVECGASF